MGVCGGEGGGGGGVVNVLCTFWGSRDDVIFFPQSDPGYSFNLAQSHWRKHRLREEGEEEEEEEEGEGEEEEEEGEGEGEEEEEEGEGLLAPYLVKLNLWTQQQRRRKLRNGF